MSKTKYNGWRNYATWRVRLELFDEPCEVLENFTAQDCKDWAENYIADWADSPVGKKMFPSGSGYNLITGWALAFMDDVDWQEIADSLTCDELVF